MKIIVKNRVFKNYAVLMLFITIIEMLFRIISGIKLLDLSFLRVFLGANILALVFSFLISWLPRIGRKIAMIIICLVISIYSFFQMGFNNFIGVYASVHASSQLGAVKEYIADFFGSFLIQYYLIFIPFILFVLYNIFFEKKLSEKFEVKNGLRFEPLFRFIICLVVCAIYGILYNTSLTVKFMQNELQTVSTKELFHYPTVPSIAVNQFGAIGFGLLDLKTLGMEIPKATVTKPNKSENNEPTTDEVVSRVIDDTLWEKVLKDEKSSTMKDIGNFLINRDITDYNDHTGMFEGKNLIVLMLESVNEVIINPDLYPNFYKMYSEGISFKNNYSPRNNCSTGNNEFSGMTGLYTIQNNCTANRFMYNKYPTSIFNLFNNAGYVTRSMHDYTEQYYYRRTIHKNMGSGKYYGVQDLGIRWYSEYKNWTNDEDFVKVAMNITLEDTTKPFMLWLTTVSSHQPYNTSSIEGDRFLNITQGTNYPIELRRYMSKLKTLDNALGILLDRLEEAGILDDTVIAMYADHYPYAMRTTALQKVLDYPLGDYEIERTPMVIYNSKIKSEVVEKYNSYVNLTPTLANLFGLEYDPRLYMGSDVFSDDYLDLVIFDDGSWKNSVAYYNASKANIKYYTDKELSVDEIKEINNKITVERQYSVSMIKNNYLNRLDEEIKKEKEKQEQNKQELLEEVDSGLTN